MDIKYTKQKVIQLFNIQDVSGTAGLYRILYTALHCKCINIIASYFGEPALKYPLIECECKDKCGNVTKSFKSEIMNIFFEVAKCDIDKAIHVIKSLDTSAPFDEDQLCYNRDNIAKKIREDSEEDCDCCCKCSCNK